MRIASYSLDIAINKGACHMWSHRKLTQALHLVIFDNNFCPSLVARIHNHSFCRVLEHSFCSDDSLKSTGQLHNWMIQWSSILTKFTGTSIPSAWLWKDSQFKTSPLVWIYVNNRFRCVMKKMAMHKCAMYLYEWSAHRCVCSGPTLTAELIFLAENGLWTSTVNGKIWIMWLVTKELIRTFYCQCIKYIVW